MPPPSKMRAVSKMLLCMMYPSFSGSGAPDPFSPIIPEPVRLRHVPRANASIGRQANKKSGRQKAIVRFLPAACRSGVVPLRGRHGTKALDEPGHHPGGVREDLF